MAESGGLMRLSTLLLSTAAFTAAVPAHGADALKFGAPPSWVVPQAIPNDAKPSDAPVALLLADAQIAFDPGKVTIFRDSAFRIQNPQGLAAGNLSLVWNPATETITVNKLHIIRDGKVIDVLGSGQTFTTMRRETNLDAATLDGTLTANIQPEGLQQGDIVEIATTTEEADPVLKGHVEASFANWNGVPIQVAHAILSWPESMKIAIKQTPTVPVAKRFARGGRELLEISATGVDPIVPPKGAPLRFQVGRIGEATDFTSWDQVSQLILPLVDKAAVIPPSGPLHDEVEKIRTATKDPKVRTEQALALVEERVRYVALEMGQGGLVPAPAEQTWSRRFGDCKGKSALLYGILRSLGIEAQPVLVQAIAGDVVADRLPAVDLFDHMIVRALVGGKTYWLDSTREGDTSLDDLPLPDFGWVLPLTANASLVHLVPPPLEKPSQERHIDIDSSAGIFGPATVAIAETYRGDKAVALNAVYSSLSNEQRDEAVRGEAKDFFDTFAVSSSSVQFDKAKAELTLVIKGTAKLNWKDGWMEVPTSSIGFDPDFDRQPGPHHDAPFSVSHPYFSKDIATIRLPAGMAAQEKLSPAVHETLAGVEYARAETLDRDTLSVESSERSLVPEIAYSDALAAEAPLRALSKDEVYLSAPSNYQATASDVAALASEKPDSATDYFLRASAYLAQNKVEEALADLNAGLTLDPKNTWALNKRAWVYASKREFPEAERDVSALETADPGSLLALATRGYLAEEKADYASAIEFYSKLLQRDPKNQFALTRRGLLLSASGKKTDAIEDLAAVVTTHPTDASAFLSRAEAELNVNDLDAAKQDIQKALALQPGNPAAMVAVGKLAEKSGDYRAALDAYTKQIALASAPAHSPKLGESPQNGIGGAYMHRADAYRALGQFQSALADTDSALKAGYKEPDLRLLRANIFFQMGNREAVAREADLIIQENPRSDFALVAAGKIYNAIGRKIDAVKALNSALARNLAPYIFLNLQDVRPVNDYSARLGDLQKALALDPKSSDALATRAYVLLAKGDYSDAVAAYDVAIQAAPAVNSLKLGKAVALYKEGQTADANRLFSEQQAQAKTLSDFSSICSAEARAGILLDQALKDCREATRLSPAYTQFDLGLVLLRLGKLDEAVSAFSEVITKDASSAGGYFGRALAYAAKGDTVRADADRAKALELDLDTPNRFAEYGLKFDGPAAATKTAAAAK